MTKLIDNADDVRAEIARRIEQAKMLEGVYQREIAAAEAKREPYRRERWALESLLTALDAEQPANDDAHLAVAAE